MVLNHENMKLVIGIFTDIIIKSFLLLKVNEQEKTRQTSKHARQSNSFRC